MMLQFSDFNVCNERSFRAADLAAESNAKPGRGVGLKHLG